MVTRHDNKLPKRQECGPSCSLSPARSDCTQGTLTRQLWDAPEDGAVRRLLPALGGEGPACRVRQSPTVSSVTPTQQGPHRTPKGQASGRAHREGRAPCLSPRLAVPR